jgi:tetracycline repressor-like protein
VYRRWANRDALLLQFLRGLVREIPIPDRGHIRDDLIELLCDQLGFLESEAGSLYPSLGVQAGVDRAAGEALWDLVRHRRAALDAVLRRGIERHQIRGDIDLELGLFLIWGPVYYRYLGALAGKAPIERDFIAKLVDSVLIGI